MPENTKEKSCRKLFQGWQAIILQALLFAAFLSALEFFFHITEHLEFTSRFVYPIIFSVPAGLFCEDIPEGYLELCIAYVRVRFDVSLQIVQNDYYRVFYEFMEPPADGSMQMQNTDTMFRPQTIE